MSDEPLYRLRDDGDRLLYVGVSKDWPRRMNQHRSQKPWFGEVTHIDLERHPDRVTVLTAERYAIQQEQPLYNIQHNCGRLDIEVSVSASISVSPEGLAFLAAGVCAAIAGIRWAADAAANWWVRHRASDQSAALELPPVRNPFTEQPSSMAVAMMFAFLFSALGEDAMRTMAKTSGAAQQS